MFKNKIAHKPIIKREVIFTSVELQSASIVPANIKKSEASVKRYACWIVAALASLTSGFSQTADHKRELVPFAAPPSEQKIWNLARSIAVDGKGSVIIFRVPSRPSSSTTVQ